MLWSQMACGVLAAAASDRNSYNRAVAVRHNTQIVRLPHGFLLAARVTIFLTPHYNLFENRNAVDRNPPYVKSQGTCTVAVR